MHGPELLTLFDRLTTDVRAALARLDDWGLSGRKDTQYQHDVVADDIIVPPLLEAGLRVLTEESGLLADNADASMTVVVDPVDGSTNASHGLPWYATSLCAVDEEGLFAASVTNLATGERFEAIRGEGMTVTAGSGADSAHPGPSAVAELGDALVALSGLPPSHGGWRQFRAYGAAALDMCSVAVGRFDGYVDVDDAHGVWDYAGAALICSEAGAVVGDGLGRDLVTLDPGNRRAPIAASTPELFDQLLGMRAAWSGSTT